MIAFPNALRVIAQVMAVAAVLTFPQAASSQCAGVAEEGRWRNLDSTPDPSHIDVKMLGGCGDQVLNGEQTVSSPRYTIGIWVKQLSGKFYGFKPVTAKYRLWKSQRWLQGNVYRGGTQDHYWLHAEDRGGQPQLHVFIGHESLGKSPSSQSEYWFVKTRS